MRLQELKDIVDYNVRVYGPPKLIDKNHLPGHFEINKEFHDIAPKIKEYFRVKNPGIWQLPAKNYFVRLCIMFYLTCDKQYIEATEDNIAKLIKSEDILPYQDDFCNNYPDHEKVCDGLKLFALVSFPKAEHLRGLPGYQETIRIFGKYYELPVKEKQITVGYNVTGQEFFDTIAFKKNYIEEFYFSFWHTMPKQPLNQANVFNSLFDAKQYGIPANLLLNTEEECKSFTILIEKAKDCCENLQAVSVLDCNTAKAIKEKYSWLNVHISTHGAQQLKAEELDPNIIYCVNLNEPTFYSEQQQEIISTCQERGIKIKYIVNRGCVCNKHDMMSKLTGRDIMCCQGYQCKQLRKDFPWIDLCRCNLQKEWLAYWHPDFIKLSTREKTNREIHDMLKFWTGIERTKRLSNIPIPEHKYDTYLKWCKIRTTVCKGNCESCSLCKKIYEDLTN